MSKGKLLFSFIVGFFLSVSVGYAIFSQDVGITGTSTATGTFDVEFISIGAPTCVGYTKACTSANLVEIVNDNHTLNITIDSLKYPGSSITIPVRIENLGTIPAFLNDFSTEGIDFNDNIVITYVPRGYASLNDMKNVQMNQGDIQTIDIVVTWDSNSTYASRNVEFSITLNYKQITS